MHATTLRLDWCDHTVACECPDCRPATALLALDRRLTAAGWTASMVIHYRAQRARGASPRVARDVARRFTYMPVAGVVGRLGLP